MLPPALPNQTRIASDPAEHAPLPWSDFFDYFTDLSLPVVDDPSTQATFRVYQTFVRARQSGPGETRSPPKAVFVLVHGAGHSALSWAMASQCFKSMAGSYNATDFDIVCFDGRGHGLTVTQDDANLSLERLSQDLVDVVNGLYPAPNYPSQIVLAGHSLGGSIVVDAAPRLKNVIAVAVIDVVEGTALESLAYMGGILRSRPKSFSNLDEAIAWSVRSNMVHSAESARVSVPPQLQKREQDGRYYWRTDLISSQRYWKDWFADLSSKFLSLRAGRLLLLAGTDRLDTKLTMGQMQGKFQMIVTPESGHSIQEDVPEKVVSALLELWQRNQPLDIVAIRRAHMVGR
ncbi:protein phosphatase methylesterase [Cladochytrium replicatum]|nr:protein phosphatase methylesterase [Cladochytrium replicatum]